MQKDVAEADGVEPVRALHTLCQEVGSLEPVPPQTGAGEAASDTEETGAGEDDHWDVDEHEAGSSAAGDLVINRRQPAAARETRAAKRATKGRPSSGRGLVERTNQVVCMSAGHGYYCHLNNISQWMQRGR